MRVLHRPVVMMQAFLKSYGPSALKKHLWDREYSGGKWNFADNTGGDCVYRYLEKYSAAGHILDLGCGSGNTAVELAAAAYSSYVGVDVSDVALSKAVTRSEDCGRTPKNTFTRGDMLSYVPPRHFDVILFRESLYHVPLGDVRSTLERYSKHLTSTGVCIVRLATLDPESGTRKRRPNSMVNVIESGFEVIEKGVHGDSGATVLVFKPRVQA